MKRKKDYQFKINGVAKAFFNDCKDDPEYPYTHWKDQAKELLNDASVSFIEGLFAQNPEFYSELAESET